MAAWLAERSAGLDPPLSGSTPTKTSRDYFTSPKLFRRILHGDYSVGILDDNGSISLQNSFDLELCSTRSRAALLTEPTARDCEERGSISRNLSLELQRYILAHSFFGLLGVLGIIENSLSGKTISGELWLRILYFTLTGVLE
ncbi:hypothetical protein ElyMa_003789600 [Elysia marginata]|uniref:Uncharacterized protein n=1 Tax=Elysia marginata TaxID=1093978 RepID=A0AAV4FD04_9GAST|nr:hypothetical protein ElyMa_003789600 [Elysia marginata]